MITNAEYVAILARQRARLGGSIGTKSQETREAFVQDCIEQECNRRGWICLMSRMDRATTRHLGEPDFIILADKGRTIFVEAKSRTGKLRPEQLGFKCWAEKLGHAVHVVRSVEEFLEIIKVA